MALLALAVLVVALVGGCWVGARVASLVPTTSTPPPWLVTQRRWNFALRLLRWSVFFMTWLAIWGLVMPLFLLFAKG